MRKIQIYFVIAYTPRAWDYAQNWLRYRENNVFGIENDIGSASGQIWKCKNPEYHCEQVGRRSVQFGADLIQI